MKLIAMLAAATLLASSPLLHGQETDLMSVNVPFAFTAGGVSMPAGHYVISRLQDGSLLKLRTFGHMDVFVSVAPVSLKKAPARSGLLFDRDARGYTLREVDQQAQVDGARVLDLQEAPVQQVASVTAPVR